MTAPDDPSRFILDNTRLLPVPLVPEIRLHVADEAVPIWQKTEEELGEIGLPPPFWAFAWAGGQALARFLLDNRDLVAGKRVIDFASGSGLVAIAACLAGAKTVLATEIDPFCRAAIGLNAQANDVAIAIEMQDITREPVRDADLIVAGDVFYEKDTADRVTDWFARQAGAGVPVLVGDPGRSYLPKARLTHLQEYSVPVTRELEDADIKATSVWRFLSPHAKEGETGRTE